MARGIGVRAGKKLEEIIVSRAPLRFWWIGASALLVCVGSIGPWANVLFVSVGGLDGDGWITLVIGLAALALFAVYVRSPKRPRPRWALLLILLAGVAAGIAGAYDWSNIQGIINEGQNEENLFASSISVGWGLVLVTLAGFSLAVAALATVAHRTQEAQTAHEVADFGGPPAANTAVDTQPTTAGTVHPVGPADQDLS
jgi:hypothetical protein